MTSADDRSKGYQLTGTAEAEIESIIGFVADRDGLQRAIHVHGKFVEAFELLAFQPGSGTTRPELTAEGIRWWPVFRWLVIYDPTTWPITILRVIHGARELDRLFHRDE